MRSVPELDNNRWHPLNAKVSDGAGRAMTGGRNGQQAHQYRSAAASQIDIQRLKVPVNKPPESIVAYLRSLRRYLEAKEGAKLIGCHRETFYLLISDGLPAQKRGRRWRIDPVAFANWIETCGFEPAATESSEKASAGSTP